MNIFVELVMKNLITDLEILTLAPIVHQKTLWKEAIITKMMSLEKKSLNNLKYKNYFKGHCVGCDHDWLQSQI